MISISILMHRPPDSPPWELQACVIDNLEDSRGPTTPLVLGGQGHKPFLFAPLPKLAAPPFPETSHAGLQGSLGCSLSHVQAAAKCHQANPHKGSQICLSSPFPWQPFPGVL